MALTIQVSGVTAKEGKQLEDFLRDLEGVESVRARYAIENLRPGTIHASVSDAHFYVTLALFSGASAVGTTLVGEITKDAYRAAKTFIRQQVEEWARHNIPHKESRRIELEFSEQGELTTKRPN